MKGPHHSEDELNEGNSHDNGSPADGPSPRLQPRRSILKKGALLSSGAVLGGAVLSGTATGSRGNLVSKINSDGHWAYFPFGPSEWGRQKHPFDYRDGESRWLAEPARGGAVRCLVKDIEIEAIPGRNAGFDLHLGPLSGLEDITITSETVQAQASEATLFVGLYLDEDTNGEFFVWEQERGDVDNFVGVGDDEEGIFSIDAGGSFTIDDSTTMLLLSRWTSVEWGELRRGNVDGIDTATPAGLYVGVADRGGGSPEEAIIKQVEF